LDILAIEILNEQTKCTSKMQKTFESYQKDRKIDGLKLKNN